MVTLPDGYRGVVGWPALHNFRILRTGDHPEQAIAGERAAVLPDTLVRCGSRAVLPKAGGKLRGWLASALPPSRVCFRY